MSISVLCVDDDPELLELAKAFLEELERLEVDTVTSAQEALQMLRKRKYEAVVSDYQMPDVDGIEFLKQFRSLDQSTPFIIFTGRGMEEVAIEALNNGASFYLQKGGEARSQFALLEHKILSAVEKRKAEERVRVLGRLYQVISATNRSILQARSEGELLRSITDLAVSLGEFRLAWIGIFEDNGRVVHHSFSSVPEVVVPESTSKGPPPKFASSVRSQVKRAMTIGAVVCNNVRTDLPASDWKGFMQKSSCSSFAILPIHSSSKPIGALVLCSGDEGSFNGEVIDLMREMANDISFAMENLEARARIDKLVAGLRRSNTKMEALYRVAHAANSTKHPDDFYRSIHAILLELMPAKNFFIALWDQEKGEVSYPYFVDEFDAPPPPEKAGKGLTAHVLLTGRSLLAPPQVFDELVRRGEVESLGAPSVDWLGVPLRRGDCTIGAMVTQSYAEGVHLGENERQIMEFISDQVAMAIERKKAEEAMRESEERYASLFDRMIDLVYIQDFQGNILDANPAALKAFGYSIEEVKALNIMNLISPAQLTGAYEAIKTVTKTGSLPHFLEFDLKRKDGTYITVEVSGSLLYHEGKPYAIQGVARDITDRRSAEEALKESEERGRSIVASAPYGIHFYALNTEGNLIFTGANPAADQILKVDHSRYLGMSIEEAFPSSVGTDIPVHYKQVASNGVPWHDEQIEYQDKLAQGTFDVHAFRYSPGHMAAAFLDISERKRMDAALREATKKLHILNGITRHDILNQLVTLVGFLDLYKRSLGGQASHPYLAKVEHSVEVIRKQVEFTRDYEAMGTTSPEWHSLAKLVRGVPQSKDIEHLEIGSMAERLTILADRMLPKVFGNLVHNSLKHGGRVTKVMVDCRETGGGVILSYADDGVGIPMDDKERIFDKGFGKGTGLGLFLSKEVLGITGITIKENGEPGIGVRYEMFVPQGSYALADSTMNGK